MKKNDIAEMLQFFPRSRVAQIIRGTVFRSEYRDDKVLEQRLIPSNVTDENMLMAGTLLFQGVRANTVWDAPDSIGWFCTDPKLPMVYAGSCADEPGYVNQFRVKTDMHCATHCQVPVFIFMTSGLLRACNLFQSPTVSF